MHILRGAMAELILPDAEHIANEKGALRRPERSPLVFGVATSLDYRVEALRRSPLQNRAKRLR
jgi:hypothetical protein